MAWLITALIVLCIFGCVLGWAMVGTATNPPSAMIGAWVFIIGLACGGLGIIALLIVKLGEVA